MEEKLEPWMGIADYPTRWQRFVETGGDLRVPLAAPPLRVVREKEAPARFRAEKGAFQDLVTSLGRDADS